MTANEANRHAATPDATDPERLAGAPYAFDPERALALLHAFASEPRDSRLAFKVHYWGITPVHRDNPVHKHSFYEICYVVEGSGRYMDEGRWHELGPGTLFCSRPGVLHQIRSESGMYLLFVAFETDAAHCNPDAARAYQSLYATNRYLLAEAGGTASALLWQSLMRQLEAPHPTVRESLASTAHALLASFPGTFRRLAAEEGGPALPRTRMARYLLSRAQVFIKDNLAQPLPLDTVARYLHVSGRHLSRLFASELGVGYVQFVRKERVRHAAELLACTDLSVQEIAERTGFASVHYFTRVFAQETGLPPARYRQSAHGGKAAERTPFERGE
jgi:AraC-like DNA-binding protein/mannose-6-phosphate isomerase-like protein (cupin superfamily)